MRLLLAFFLSLCLSFNAAYAAGADVCDALEAETSAGLTGPVPEHGEHLGHHVHDHEPGPDAAANSAPSDPAAQTVHADHCHPHQCFTSVIPDEVTMPSLAGHQILPIAPSDQLASLSPSRLERPPRAALA